MRLSEAAKVMKGTLQFGKDADADVLDFSAVSTDTRQLKAGELFFALSGPNFNAHDFLAEVAAKGAVAAVIAETESPKAESIEGLNCILVEDVLLALGQLAKAWRDQFDPQVVAITGSCGKTTVKEMVAAILSEAGQTLATRGNFNNEIGVPLTLFRLTAEDRYAVIECGANGAGQISYTAGLVQPHVALVNNVAAAHIEGFGSLQGIATAKGEIYHALRPGGVSVLNRDDDYYDFWKLNVNNMSTVSFSRDNEKEADVYLLGSHSDAAGSWDLKVHTPKGELSVKLPLLGGQNVINALAAISCVLPLGIGAEHIEKGLAKLTPVKGRMSPALIGEVLLVDDTYNANEASVEAAIRFLGDNKFDRTILVLGDLAELGHETRIIHMNLGSFAQEKGIHHLIGVGSQVHASVSAFGEGGIQADSHQAAAEACVNLISGKTCVLVKGSRSSAMEKVVEVLTELLNKPSEVSP